MYRLLFLFLLVPVFVSAHQPSVVSFDNYSDLVTIENPQISQAFYGELNNFPHTYEFTIDNEQGLFVEVLVPDIEGVNNNRSAIIVRKKARGGVEEVARLSYKNAGWESFYEPFGGDSYRRGASFSDSLPAGEYIVEVNTAENLGKYVLVVGVKEDFSDLGYFASLKRIYQVKKFFGKPAIAVFQSPFYYVPGVLLLIIIGSWFYYRKRKHYA